MSTAFFDRWFPDETHNWSGYFAEVAALLPAHGKVLDLGCGANSHLARFRTPQCQVWGTDLHRHPELAHADWFRLMPPDGTIPFPDNSFDLITTFMVVEHVTDPAFFLSEVHRVLRPGGHFLAHTISALHYVTWVHRLFDLFPHSWTQRLVRRLYGREEHDTFPTCYRMNTPARIARLARPLGFAPVRVQRYAYHGYFEFSPLLHRCAIVAEWLLDQCVSGLGRIYFTAAYRKAVEAPVVAYAPAARLARAAA